MIASISPLYSDLGDSSFVCSHCGAFFWSAERLVATFKDKKIHYHRCCENGRVSLPLYEEPPMPYKQLLDTPGFIENIRAYNQMFSMTSFGGHVDETINTGNSPYVFKVSGQIYHWIGGLCPPEGVRPRFLQLYIYDTDHEVENRMSHFGGQDSGRLCQTVVVQLIQLLDSYNKLVRLFRTARDKCRVQDVPTFKVHLFSFAGSRQHSLPASDAIGAIVFDSGVQTISDYDVVIEPKSDRPRRINKLHPLYMSLQFPLMFFYDEQGFHPELMLRSVSGSQNTRLRKMSMNMYYSFQLHERLNVYNLILSSGRLFQQYVVTVYCSIELDRMDYIRKNQKDIRSEYLSGLYDAIDRGDQKGSDVGSRTTLPASFTGGPRYMYSHYLDALAICRVFGNPQFFITFTCNAKWPEISRYLKRHPRLTPSDRADIVARVFHMKVKEFIVFLKEQKPFGDFRGVLYTIEFQKRGLPHCHTLLWLHSATSVPVTEHLDDYISAELPDPRTDPKGYAVVSATMMHGPCGIAKPSAPCTEGFVCKKKFPKQYTNNTFFDSDGRAHYRRRNTGVYTTRSGVKLDNSYVVPYNRLLCMAFHAHINVECCGSTTLIKYLFKYISKGTDRVATRISQPLGVSGSVADPRPVPVDEVQNYIDARFICPHEACWRIIKFPIHHRDPAVQILSVHLENMQLLKFRENHSLTSIVATNPTKKTTLTEWLVFNNSSTLGSHLTYLEFPSEFVWNDSQKKWQRRVNLKKPSIGRISYIHPTYGEAFFLRMLLCHQRGCKNFSDIRTVNNIVHDTYRLACQAAGLLGDDKEWATALQEASAYATATQLRSLFVHILVYCMVSNPVELWEKHWKLLSDDIPIRASETLKIPTLYVNKEDLHNYVLFEVEVLLNQCSKSTTDFGLPTLPPELLLDLANRLIMEERNYNRESLDAERLHLERSMNAEQKEVYELVTNASLFNQPELVFVYGHGGTGKTFLWKSIITSLRARGKIVLAVASSGVASLLLPSGM